MVEQQAGQQQGQQQMSEEQVKALQEKLKQMSPEELKEFQKKQCIFCQIIAGRVQSKKIFEDDAAIAVLDVNPANPGHMLVMPKEHYTIMPQIPQEEVEHIFLVAKMLSNSALRALNVKGSNLVVANGVAAGQRAQHFMVHLIPRTENDDIKFTVPQKNIPEEELEKIQKQLSEGLGQKISQQAPKPASKKAVEAEFEDKKEQPGKTETKAQEKKPVKKITEKNQAEEKKQGKAKEEVDLDDIADLLGGK